MGLHFSSTFISCVAFRALFTLSALVPPVENGYMVSIQRDNGGKYITPFLTPTKHNYCTPQSLLHFKDAQKSLGSTIS